MDFKNICIKILEGGDRRDHFNPSFSILLLNNCTVTEGKRWRMTQIWELEYGVGMELPLPSETSVSRQKERCCFKIAITMVAKVMSERERGEIK